eukprot:CAMPEP_0198122046 /NCGR_PEP_ID=MMETSP1442-20131203/33776_1 /TAXON_ID= /ORGANISM="Craspedostauros australis, Strain CCMP3328" /LENGTH=70 /DNA_ID=CAMNT_0043780979 /DNA_START=175 /DNA_END=383 /DNA_ORIENTATION=-
MSQAKQADHGAVAAQGSRPQRHLLEAKALECIELVRLNPPAFRANRHHDFARLGRSISLLRKSRLHHAYR